MPPMDSLIEPDDLSSQEELLRAPWGELGRSLTLGVVAGLSKLVLNVFNTLTTENEERFLEHVLHRDPGVGMITVSNHTRFVDLCWCGWYEVVHEFVCALGTLVSR